MAAAHSNRAYRRFEDVDWANWIPQQRATLLFVICHGHMLLIHKKRGLGVGKTIGPGGRLAPGESALRGALYVRYKRNSALHLLARSSVVSLPFSSRMAVRHDGAERRPRWSPSRSLAAQVMEEGPPEPACRSRLQTTGSCSGQEPLW
jgi:hypothetical protein